MVCGRHKEENMAEIVITGQNFEQEVLKSDKPVLVDFWASWCGPCMMMAPEVEMIAKEKEGIIKVGKVNVDEEQGLAAQFNIMSIPTLILFKDGKPAEVMIGYRPKEEIEKILN
jgi:thioredoxin 1